MLAEERFESILKLLDEQGAVSVSELTQLLKTSESTIRRDLTELNRLGLVNKVHGGATTSNVNYKTKDEDLEYRQALYKDEKIRIAKYCAALINDKDFVFLDAGSTVGLMIDYLKTTTAVFVTNAIDHAHKLATNGHKVHILNGELKSSTEAVVGSETVECLEKYNFTKGFFGANGISLKAGFTTPESNEALVKKKALSKCREKYIVCDASKFNQISSVTFCSFKDATIITNKIEDSAYTNCNNIVEVVNSDLYSDI